MTPLVPREEPPSYFNLWRSQDAKPYADIKDKMAVLPPLSSMMANAPNAPALPKRPLPALPNRRPPTQPTSEASESFNSNFDPSQNMGSEFDESSDRTVRSPDEQASGIENYFTPASVENYFTPAGSDRSSEVPSGPTNSLASSEHTYNASEMSRNTSEEAARSCGSPAPFSSYHTPTAAPYSESPPLNEDVTPPARARSELIWPAEHAAAYNLPPGARASRTNTGTEITPAPIDEEEAFYPRAIRYGFSTDTSPELPYSRDTDVFPDVVQLSNSAEEDSGLVEFNMFAMEAPTWENLLRFLNLFVRL